MKIGILSDTHDNIPNIKKAVDIFNKNGVDVVIHCGDFTSLFVIKELKNLKVDRILSVYGNNDGERTKLKEWLKDINPKNEIDEYLSVELDNLKFFILHGTYREILDCIIESNKYDVVVYGHTHDKVFKKVNNTIVINPGECCGYLTGKGTVGIFDTETKDYIEYNL